MTLASAVGAVPRTARMPPKGKPIRKGTSSVRFADSFPRGEAHKERNNNMSKAFWKAAWIRALRTLCQTAAATIGTTALLQEVDWLLVLSGAALAALLSVLNSIATGLPEAKG